MKSIFKVSFLLAAALFMFSACNKDEELTETITDEEKIASKDYSLSQDIYSEVWNIVMEESKKSPAMNGLYEERGAELRTCPTITVTPQEQGAYPKTMVIDFGTGCGDISGRITVVASAPVNQAGTNLVVQLDDLTLKGYQVEGSYNMTSSQAGSFSGSISGGSVTTPEGETITYQGTLSVTQTAGQGTTGTEGISDDVYSISLEINGTDRDGNNYTAVTVEPVIKDFSCEWIVSGTVEVKSGLSPKKTLNFGSGNCDNVATLSVGRMSYTINLP